MAQAWQLKQKHYAILNFAGITVDPATRSSDDQQQNLRKKLQDGLFFSNTLKYWASNSGKDCFALYARLLRITGSDDPSCWIWYQDQGPGEPKIEVAESVKVRWLEARIRFSTVNLQQSATYDVFFVVKVKERQMLDVSLNVKLVLPDGSKQETQRQVPTLNKWERLPVGTFTTTYSTIGILDISLQQVDDKWKERIVIKGVQIVAKD